MVAEAVAALVLVIAYAAEMLHWRRQRRVAMLAFGPGERPAAWARGTPVVRAMALAALAWGLVTLLLIDPKIHKAEEIDESEMQHLLLVLDVSPSMRLVDAGPEKKLSRMERTREVMESFFDRVNIHRYRISVIAVYNEAKSVVEDTKDMEVIRNILGDLPMHHAFRAGETDLFSGLSAAADLAQPWNPRSTTVVLLSDGDTVPAVGMPRMPVSVANTLVVGVGDSTEGSFINGRHSRQDVSTLRQIALRLGGTYHNGNELHLPTTLISQLAVAGHEGPFENLTRREYALAACALGALIYALLPWLLHRGGTTWRPGVLTAPDRKRAVPAATNQTRRQPAPV